MKNIKTLAELKGRAFNGKVHLRVKRIRTEPRQKIRQLLRSFIPLNQHQKEAENDPRNTQ